MAKVLIVDDKASNLFALENVLKRLDVEIIKALSGEEALRATLHHDFALAILDVQMPGMDGYELASLLRGDEKTKNIPVIFLSAVYSEEPYVFKGYESGGVDFITKPFSCEILLSKVRIFLELAEQKAELIRKGVRLERLVAELEEQVEARKRAEEEIRKAYDSLEEKVQERTAELKDEIETRKTYMTRLEQSNRELENFAFVASHDLQEPLRKIQTFSDRLRKTHYDCLDDHGRDYLARMERSAARMQDLILDLLQYSRVTTKPEPFRLINLKQCVEEAAMDLKILCEETEGTIEVGELPSIEADGVQMRQLFQNLIGNALKYRGEYRPVVKVYCDTAHLNEFWQINVEDNGIGFDECYLDKIFKPFQRLHGRNSVYQGTGMGLAICRRIVERHGGSITARSKPGRGAIFVVTLRGTQSKSESRP